MATIAELQVRIGADLSDLQKKLDSVGGKLKAFGDKMEQIGRQMTTKVTAPIIGLGVATLKTASDFETGMNKVKALTGATGADLESLREKAQELGATTQFSAGQAADAMGFLAMAGFDTDQILGSMKSTLDLAAGAQMDLGKAADIVSNVMTGYNMRADESSRATDVLTVAFTTANTNLEQLGQAMKFTGPVASGAGVKFEEAAAALGLMGNAGIQAGMAGTSLRGAIVRLLNPTGAVSEALKDLGIKATDSDGNLKSLENIVGQLETSGASTADMMAIFGQRAGPAMQALVSQGSGALREMTQTLENSGGTAERIAGVQMEGLRGALLKLKSAAEAMAISLADSGLLKWVTDLADRLANFVRKLADTSPEILKMVTVAAGLAAALGPLALAISGVIAVMNPWVLAIGAVVAAGATLITRWEEISAWFTQRFPGVAEAFTKAWDDIRSAVVDALARIQEFWAEWGDEITGVASAIFNHVVTIVQTGLSVVGDTLGLFINLFTGDWAGLWDNVKGIFGAVWDGIKSIFTNAINALIALMPDFVKEWLGLTDDFKIGASEMEAGTKDIEAATWNFKRSAEQTTDAVAGGSGSYASALGSVGDATRDAKEKTEEITQTMEGLRKKLDDALIPAWNHYNGLVIKGAEANSELDASVLRTTTAVEDLEQPVNDLSIGFKGWVSILSSGSGVGSAIEHVKGKLGGAGGLIDLIGSETGLLGKLTGPGGLVGALGQDGLVGRLQSVTAALGPAGAAFAAVVGVVATYSDEINSAISATSEFLGFGDSAQDKMAEGILSEFQSSIIESFNASGMSASAFIDFMESSDPGSVAAALGFGGFATVGEFEDFLNANGSYTAPAGGSVASASTELSALLAQYSGISSDAGYLFDFLTGLNQFDYIVSSTDIGSFEAQDYLAGLLGLSYVTTEDGIGGFADTSGGTIQGDVYLDGEVVGEWISKSTTDGGLVV